MRESMPRRCRRCPSISPAGPAPTIATCVRNTDTCDLSQRNRRRREGEKLHISPLLPFACCIWARLSLEREVQRPDTEQPEQREGSHAGAIHHAQHGVLAWREHQIERLPEQRVVRTQAMLARRDL